MRLLISSRTTTFVLVATALLARPVVADATGSASDPGRSVVERVVVVEVPAARDADHDGTAEVTECCALSGTLPAVGWYARSFRARSWREFLLPFAGRGEAECP